MFDLIIIGAGAAGLFAAANVHVNNRLTNVLLIDSKKNPGRKLALAGGGICNFTHDGKINTFYAHYGDKKNFVKKALNAYDNEAVIHFMKGLGIESEVDKRGKVFPLSENGEEIVDRLIKRAHQNGVTFKFGEKVIQISKNEEGTFTIQTEEASYEAKRILIATGGKSYPGTGSDGVLYPNFQTLGHQIISLKPALAPIFGKTFDLVSLAGVSFEHIEMHLIKNNKNAGTFHGEILITHKGLSGPVILDHSKMMDAGDLLKINFTTIAGATAKSMEATLLEMAAQNGKMMVKTMIRSVTLTKSLGDHIFNKMNLNEALKLSELTKENRKQLAELLAAYPIEIKAVGDYFTAMATAGGIDTRDLNSSTMESKKIDQLYFAGEVIDVVGDSGGYNIQFAFSSGFLAIKSM